MPKFDDFAFMDATAQAELVRRKEVKPTELVEAAIERIERLNPILNAVVTPMYDLARDIAKSKLPDGPFTGVPFLLKDILADYAGVRMTAGSAFLQDWVPYRDSELVVRLKRAGLIVVGRTNTPEFGLVGTTEPRFFGPCRNPWDTERSTGGSSGGSAAAVASGMVPMAHGNDGGGSIRIPASCCGVFGLKPTRGRNPLGPNLGDVQGGFVCEHVLTRSVRDSAALLDATSGPDVGDPYCAPSPARPYIEEVGANPARLRIAFTAEPITDVPVHKDCRDAVHEAAWLCEELGHTVEEAKPTTVIDGNQAVEAFLVVYQSALASTLDGILHIFGETPNPAKFEPLTLAIYKQGQKYSASDYILAWQLLHRFSREIARFFIDYDVLLTPTIAQPPILLGAFNLSSDNPLEEWSRLRAVMPFTRICNITGQPAMSVPLFWNANDLPIGTQFIGRFGDEATLFRLAAQLEKARPWASRRPPTIA
ncbi:MAG: amidase [Candidatus Abyssobacteria bacterium SURF_17]|uniref:Amidase n=1 Tax=Candidatus Abyssobacteria bacterium SURF_17 TaxID=2093361 RepID=A0A419F6C9_9BACT|nr:MAG: amidase [Candidatus Abyssubacteria bacterium SURF_17]